MMEDTLKQMLPIVLFIGLMVGFLIFVLRKNKSAVNVHLELLREKNEILSEISESLKKIAEKKP